ncbi:hypothetical protein [uncultured Alistipes sp.]|jgi:hypothetical protein|uniref:hypothetical protein n=1 Tax=uncultured Alistipes sp. TaxID=538949 RepID=UPI00272C479A|nr:hypothetical protein [uncultured Alistipes sp.]
MGRLRRFLVFAGFGFFLLAVVSAGRVVSTGASDKWYVPVAIACSAAGMFFQAWWFGRHRTSDRSKL